MCCSVGREAALAQIHNVYRIELLDAEIVGQLIGDVVTHIVQDTRSVTLDRSNNSRGGGFNGADDTAQSAQDPSTGRCRGSRCGGRRRGCC